MNGKIQATHLERRAIVYLRQSTLRQVHGNHEFSLRQDALGQRAIELGWPSARVEVIDNDLGRSGTTTEAEPGSSVSQTTWRKVRSARSFALEASRLARSSADWHRLLDLYGLADVVIVDEQTVYTPRAPSDRLLLGPSGHGDIMVRARSVGKSDHAKASPPMALVEQRQASVVSVGHTTRRKPCAKTPQRTNRRSASST